MKKSQKYWQRQTENILFVYPELPFRIKSLTQQLELIKEQYEPSLISSYELRYGTNYNVSIPLEQAVMDRIESDPVKMYEQAIRNAESNKTTIEETMDIMLDANQKELVKMYYFERKDRDYVADMLGMSVSTFYREKKKVVKIMAWALCQLPKKEAFDFMRLFMDPHVLLKS